MITKNNDAPVISKQGRFIILNTQYGGFALIELPDNSIHSQWIDQKEIPEYLKFDHDLLPEVFKLLGRYFAGESDVNFSCVPIPKGPPFFHKCWVACKAIPIGTTISYAKLAEAAGSPGAIRAAGQAMRRNPLPVIIPCHRVISASGDLYGFSGSTDPNSPELSLKATLLKHENALLIA